MPENTLDLIISEIVKRIVESTLEFEKIIKENWGVSSKEVTKEYLTFIMYCATSMLQENEFGQTQLDDFHKSFYKEMVYKKILAPRTLLDYEKMSRERYMDFLRILGEGELTGKKLSALIAKEVLCIEKLLPEEKKKENAIGELYAHLFSSYHGLMLQIQLIFSLTSP